MAPGGASLSLLAHAGALVLIYSLYSLLQEKIMKTTYGQNSEHFTSASLLVLSNRFFSLATGVCFSLLLPASGEQLSAKQRLTPKWPLYFYAMVAAANFASTYCQYDALRYVGFTTQALAKCAKMVPVLLIGRLFYKKSYKQKEFVAGGVVLFGCFIYLVSRPSTPIPSKHSAINSSAAVASLAPIIGAFLLCSYLFFDGLTSTTQEHYFGKTRKDVAPLTPGGPVLDQMVYVNLCATAVSAIICVANLNSTLASLSLALQSQQLLLDITMLSATATFGLVILYDTIFKHGALTVATTMTLRQFFSILLNAGIFGNFGMIGFGGWLGVGFVAAGVWIKTDRRYDAPKPILTTPNTDDKASSETLLGKLEQLPMYATPEEEGLSMKRMLAQYGMPLCCPLLFALIASVFI